MIRQVRWYGILLKKDMRKRAAKKETTLPDQGLMTNW
jgi:hypothetical protein